MRRGLFNLPVDEKEAIFRDYQRGLITIQQLADKHRINYSAARTIIKRRYRKADNQSRKSGGYLGRLYDRAPKPDEILKVTQKKAQRIYLDYCALVARQKKSINKQVLREDPFLKMCNKHHISDFTLRRIIQFYAEKKEHRATYGFDQITAYRKNLG